MREAAQESSGSAKFDDAKKGSSYAHAVRYAKIGGAVTPLGVSFLFFVFRVSRTHSTRLRSETQAVGAGAVIAVSAGFAAPRGPTSNHSIALALCFLSNGRVGGTRGGSRSARRFNERRSFARARHRIDISCIKARATRCLFFLLLFFSK